MVPLPTRLDRLRRRASRSRCRRADANPRGSCVPLVLAPKCYGDKPMMFSVWSVNMISSYCNPLFLSILCKLPFKYSILSSPGCICVCLLVLYSVAWLLKRKRLDFGSSDLLLGCTFSYLNEILRWDVNEMLTGESVAQVSLMLNVLSYIH
jgi:hypothetical protein